ncbi:hypothetical protein FRC11_013959 [Ceratobasidium sp. 423]|nr:hypothetical protein FRC11_013959 [Ceratobasidium sp. 423]
MNEQGPDVPLKDFGVGPTKGAPRKFVIFFHAPLIHIEHDSEHSTALTGKFPPDWGRKYDTQVVHHPWLSKIEQPSRKDRLFIRLGLGTEKASIDNAVAEAYALLASEYLLGDEVIFLIDISPVRDMKSILDPAETLARHLGTHSDFSFIYSTRHVIHYNQDNTPDLYPPTFANAEHPSDAKSNRKPKADVYEMETVTPGFIAYVAVALRYTLSNETSFMESSDTFNYVVFYHEIVTYLESPEFADKTQDLAKRWDDRIFPHKIPALDNPSSMLARFREQRAEAAARGNRASSEDNND